MQLQRGTAAIEEDEVEREAHPEGVDAGAAGDQQPGPGLAAVDPGESKQAGAEAAGDPNLVPEDAQPRQISQS